MWSKDIKCKYMFMFPLKNLARKGLKLISFLDLHEAYMVLVPGDPYYLFAGRKLQ